MHRDSSSRFVLFLLRLFRLPLDDLLPIRATTLERPHVVNHLSGHSLRLVDRVQNRHLKLELPNMPFPRGAAPTWRLFAQLDESRRMQGRMLDVLGFGPRETPSRVVLREPGLTLKAYGDTARAGPAVLLVPAPIKRAYIWDLAPGASVVQQCLAYEARTYLAQWEEPPENFGLNDYAARLLLDCADAIRAETTEEKIFLFGHSLGGLLAAIFAALHPARLRGLVTVASPLHFEFTPQAGVLGPVIAQFSRWGLLDAEAGNLPGSLLSLASFMASPQAFGHERLLDWLRSARDYAAFKNCIRVERWALDELPLARELVRDIAERLYRDDGFLGGTLELDHRAAAARQVVSPLLIVADPHCPIVPPQAILPFMQAAAQSTNRCSRMKAMSAWRCATSAC